MSNQWTSGSRQRTKNNLSSKNIRKWNRIEKTDLNYIYGRVPLLSYLGRGKIHSLYLLNGFQDKEILSKIKAEKIIPQYVSNEKLNELAQGGNHQGVVALVDEYVTYSLEELLESINDKKNPVLVILDEVNDPHNVGAIIRNMDAFGIDGLIIKNRRQAQLTSTVYKVSTGALTYTKVAVVANLVNAIKTLKDKGYWIYACSQKAAKPYNQINFDTPSVIIFGNEGEGISRLVLENSDISITIPMVGHVESLNVASASAIILSYIRNSK